MEDRGDCKQWVGWIERGLSGQGIYSRRGKWGSNKAVCRYGYIEIHKVMMENALSAKADMVQIAGDRHILA